MPAARTGPGRMKNKKVSSGPSFSADGKLVVPEGTGAIGSPSGPKGTRIAGPKTGDAHTNAVGG